MIFKSYKVGDMPSNNYLLVDEISKEAVLIDCTGDFEIIKKDIEENGAKLKYILLTHAHFDHIMGCNDFKKEYPNAKLCLHKGDEILLDNVKTQCAYFGLAAIEKPTVDEFINEKSELNIGNYKIETIHTPGHSKGSCSFVVDNRLFSGDTLFYEEIGRCDLPGGSFDEIKSSIENKLFFLTEQTPVYPGHGLESTIGHEKEFNCYFGKNSRYI